MNMKDKRAKLRLSTMSKADVEKLSPIEFEEAFKNDRLFTVREAIEWLSKQNPDAGLFYFETNSNAWCDMPSSYFRTVKEEKEIEKEHLNHWFKDDANKEEKIKNEFDEVFRYVEDDDICVIG